jgi:hypothetical protein
MLENVGDLREAHEAMGSRCRRAARSGKEQADHEARAVVGEIEVVLSAARLDVLRRLFLLCHLSSGQPRAERVLGVAGETDHHPIR